MRRMTAMRGDGSSLRIRKDVLSLMAAMTVIGVLLVGSTGHAESRMAIRAASAPVSRGHFVDAALLSLTAEDKSHPDHEIRALRRYVYRHLPWQDRPSFG
jgi:hypothetical protein